MVVRRQRMYCAMIEWMSDIVSEYFLKSKIPLISKLMVVGNCISRYFENRKIGRSEMFLIVSKESTVVYLKE